MTQLIQFEGQTHAFPDDFSNAEITTALSSLPASPPGQSGGATPDAPWPGMYQPQNFMDFLGNLPREAGDLGHVFATPELRNKVLGGMRGEAQDQFRDLINIPTDVATGKLPTPGITSQGQEGEDAAYIKRAQNLTALAVPGWAPKGSISEGLGGIAEHLSEEGGGKPPPPPSATAAPAATPSGGAAMVQALPSDARAALSEATQRAGITPANIDALEQGAHPNQMLGEVTPEMQDEMAGVAAPTGEAKNVITDALTQRADQAGPRLDAALTDTFGPYVDPAVLQRQLRLIQTNTASPLYKAWNETPVPMTPEIAALMPRLEATGAVRSAAQALREEGLPATASVPAQAPPLNSDRPPGPSYLQGASPPPQGVVPALPAWTARAYDYMKGHLDNQIAKGIQNGDGRSVQRWTNLKNQLTNAIDNHPDPNVAGVWKDGREAFAAPARVMDAADLGRRFFDPRVGLDQLQQRFANASQPERQGLLSGVRADAAHRLEGTASGDQTLRRTVSSTEAQRKVAWLVGEQRAAQFNQSIKNEAQMAQAPQLIIGNKYTGASAETRALAAKNWTPKPNPAMEHVHAFIKPGDAPMAIAAEMIGSAVGAPGLLTTALAGGGALASRFMAKAAETKSAAIRDAVSKVMVLKGADRGAALREILKSVPSSQGRRPQ